jgi:hypothetical protein
MGEGLRYPVRAWAVGASLLLGCGSDPVDPEGPRIQSVVVQGVSGNALAALVTVASDTADSLMVHYGRDAAGTPLDSTTPVFPFTNPSSDVPVLGLEPDQGYRLAVTAWRGTLATTSAPVSFTTGSLPEDIPRYEAVGDDASPGYVIFAAGRFLLAIDNTGRIVWYHRLAEGPSLNFMAQPNGRYVARPMTSDPSDTESWIELDILGQTTRRLGCAGGMVSRPHDLIALADGTWWLLCDDTRSLDLSSLGGLSVAKVTGTAVQHVGAFGELLFHWTPFSHFQLQDIGIAALNTPSINWTHGNALDLATDGTLVVSFRNLSEITGIDTRSGEVLWRFGGARNQFACEGTGTPPFASQHGLRLVEGGLLLLDNLGDSRESRAERYQLDVTARTARLVAAYEPSDPVIAELGGTTQLLANGHTLVSFGNGGRVEEYDASGRMVWRINGNPGYVFRAQRIGSLYAPGVAQR